MLTQTSVLLVTAASLGFFHTMVGPDHYLPFAVMSKSGNWTFGKTMILTALCGIAHVLSSILIGVIGILTGLAVTKLEYLEHLRGNVAAWALVTFGFIYLIWGLRRAFRNVPHTHGHGHADGDRHVHTHVHTQEHLHVHEKTKRGGVSPWILFTIFLFGPCEPLIPLLMYPAAKNSREDLFLVITVFAATTVITMLTMVFLATLGLKSIRVARFDRFSHAMAGASIVACGLSIVLLGL